MKGKGEGRPRSLSPTGSPHRNSKGDGKGSDDGSAQGIRQNSGKSPSRESEQTTFHKLPEWKLPKEPNVQNSKLQVDATSETSVQNLLTQEKFQHRLLFTFHRMMQIRKKQSDDKTQCWVRLHHLASKSV